MTDCSPTRSLGWQPDPIRCRKLIVFLSIASLSITLANRIFRQSGGELPTVAAHAASAKLQHRDRISPHCPAPLRTCAFRFRSIVVGKKIYAEDERLPVFKTDASLYNRPPPRT
jgi:hypothetical protein